MKCNAIWLTGFIVCTLIVAVPGGTFAADGDVTVPIMISPSVVNLESQGMWVTVHAEIPYSAVDGYTVTLDGVPVKTTKADARGEFVAKFAIDDVKAILSPGTVLLTLAGSTYDGTPFTGSDTIKVIRVSGRR